MYRDYRLRSILSLTQRKTDNIGNQLLKIVMLTELNILIFDKNQ